MSNAPETCLEFDIELRWSDQDLLGHVNNAKLMTLAEEARIRALTQLQQRFNIQLSLDTVLRTTQTDFLRPVMYDGSVKIFIWISQIGNTSFVMQHELHQNGHKCVTVEAVVVLFDPETETSASIPDDMRAALESVAA